MNTLLAARPPIKIARTWEPVGKGPHSDIEKRVAYGLFHIPATAFFLDGVAVTGFSLVPRDDGWLAVLKGKRASRKLVAFFWGNDWREAVTLLVTSCDSGHADWRLDKPKPPGR